MPPEVPSATRSAPATVPWSPSCSLLPVRRRSIACSLCCTVLLVVGLTVAQSPRSSLGTYTASQVTIPEATLLTHLQRLPCAQCYLGVLTFLGQQLSAGLVSTPCPSPAPPAPRATSGRAEPRGLLEPPLCFSIAGVHVKHDPFLQGHRPTSTCERCWR